MNKKSSLSGRAIRAAVVRLPDVGYIIACDLQKEEKEIPHAIIFKWNAGTFTEGDRNYNARTVTVIEFPELGYVDAAQNGYYSVTTSSGMISGDILGGTPRPAKPRILGITSLSSVGGKAYAVGYGGMVYRLDELRTWTRIDEGLPDTVDLTAIHGFEASDLYAVGKHGELWHYNGNMWKGRQLPTNRHLNTVKCAEDGNVYIAGYGGTLIRGRGEAWEIVEQQQTKNDIWDVEWFGGQLYVSTMSNLYRLKTNELEAVDFGSDPPRSCYQLSSAKGVMWSNGEFDIMSFDGQQWTRVVRPQGEPLRW